MKRVEKFLKQDVCPDCGGSRYGKEAGKIHWVSRKGGPGISLPELLTQTVDQALKKMAEVKKVRERLQILSGLGLGYLTLGEATVALSGGEAGGQIVAAGTPEQIAENRNSVTGKYLMEVL